MAIANLTGYLQASINRPDRSRGVLTNTDAGAPIP
jgi:hypothetical protein